MYKLKITSLANKELEEIILYISEHLKSPLAATRLLDSVEECYAGLKRNPKMYECCQDERLSALGYRKAVVNNYIIIHRVDDMTKTVHILHVFYAKSDYQKLI